jgi:hypothetical protein
LEVGPAGAPDFVAGALFGADLAGGFFSSGLSSACAAGVQIAGEKSSTAIPAADDKAI